MVLLKYSAALYCRLSREDLSSGHLQQSDSIENQRLLLESYVNKHSDEFEFYDIYIDDGITGMTYDRAAFNRMMEDVYSGKVNAIIVKDLSRIGREQVETLNLIRKEFVVHNVRFIALTDDYDSLNPSKSDGLSTSVKLLLNDYYCADISKKVRAAQRAKTEHGDFIGSQPPYGYIKSPENKNKLIIDESAASIVRRIFSMYISGAGKLNIAKALNSEGIPNPTEYKSKVLGLNCTNPNKLKNTGYWTYSTINHILKNQVYIGNMVQHKSEIKAYNIHKKQAVPSCEWTVVENTHEPIISKSDFELVQKQLESKRRNLNFDCNTSKYMGLFFCKECGRAMNKYFSKPKKDGTKYIHFKCGTYSRLGKDMCTIHSINESELDEIILAEIRTEIKSALDMKSCEYIKNKSISKLKCGYEKQSLSVKNQIEANANKRKNMLKFLSEGTINAEDFKVFDTENQAEKEKLINRLKALDEKLNSEKQQADELNKWLNNLLVYKDIDKINREVLVNLVDKIYISENRSTGSKEIEIIFKFKSPMEE